MFGRMEVKLYFNLLHFSYKIMYMPKIGKKKKMSYYAHEVVILYVPHPRSMKKTKWWSS